MSGSVAGFLILFPIFLVAVVVHEVSHGWVARFLGDPTAFLAGRLTLNPLKHVDWMGTVILPLLLVAFHSPFVFGWAKPVPINPMYLRRPKRDMLWVGAAGPFANFSMAAAGALLLRTGSPFLPSAAIPFLKAFIVVNVVLGSFNLLPVPPLDGSRVLVGLLPGFAARWILALERWGMVLVVLLLASGILDKFLWPFVALLLRGLGL